MSNNNMKIILLRLLVTSILVFNINALADMTLNSATRHSPPFYIINNNKMSGLDYELAKVIFNKAGITVKSVSYTHLRAHETLMNLVCRLLLEKTTTKQNRQAHKLNRIPTFLMIQRHPRSKRKESSEE